MPTRPVIVAAVRQDAAAAQTCHAVVRHALLGGPRPVRGAETVPVAGGYDGVSAWLAKQEQSDEPAGRLVVHPEIRPDAAVDLLQEGADGVVADQSPGWLIRHAAGVVAGGGAFLDPWLAHDVADLARPAEGNLGGVTGAEQRVLIRAARGLSPKEIAADLRLPDEEVDRHVKALQKRLGGSRRELVASAQRRGLLPAGQTRANAASWETTRGLHGLGLLVVCRDAPARDTVARALAGGGARIVGLAGRASDLRTVADQWRVTVAVSRGGDLDLSEIRTARPRSALVVLPWVVDRDIVQAALGARAQAVIGVSARLADVVAAIRSAATGGLYLSTDALQLIVSSINPREGLQSAPLTQRQMEVLALADRGYSNRQIGEALGVAEATAKGHLRHALHALKATSRQEAASTARRLGLLDFR